ncbi:MAG: bifunctional DNA primase/polymerase [Nocardioidaceae bacterium]
MTNIDMRPYAVDLAVKGWPVFPLTGKAPAIRSAHPVGDPARGVCKGECGRVGHGCLDATTAPATVEAWWSGRGASLNIGIRVPEHMIVVDIDPRHDGGRSLAELERLYEPLPDTLTAWSGRGDGGRHYYFQRPPGKLSSTRLGEGIDLKGHGGYVVAPPSQHPDTGGLYVWQTHDIAACPDWLTRLLQPPPAPPARPTPSRSSTRTGASLADSYSTAHTWADVLEPHGWRCTTGDGDQDGSVWLHPSHTSACSATVRNQCLFIYSTNTPFEPTEAGDPHGYTRFRAFAVLNHGGDLGAAARHLLGKAA